MTLAQLIADVQSRCGNYWSAYDQGRYAALCGRKRTDNNFRHPHVYAWDWEQGYDSIAKPQPDMHLAALIG